MEKDPFISIANINYECLKKLQHDLVYYNSSFIIYIIPISIHFVISDQNPFNFEYFFSA